MKKIAPLILFGLFSLKNFAQTDWEKIVTQDSVEISYKIVHCNEQDLLSHQFINLNIQPSVLDFEGYLPVSNGEMPAFVSRQHLFIESSQTLCGSCGDSRPELFIKVFDDIFNPINITLNLQTIKL